MSTDAVHLDFETRSVVDLKKYGFDRYSAHGSTEPTCMAFSFNHEPEVPLVTSRLQGRRRVLDTAHPALPRLLAHVADGGLLYAHNAQFEFHIWNRRCALLYGWPELKIEQVRCTMAMAMSMTLPGALGDLGPALGLQQRKDYDGHRVMMQLCKPRKVGKPTTAGPGCPQCLGTGSLNNEACVCVEWWDDEAKFGLLYPYCQQDVRTERDAHTRMMELSPFEQHVWSLDQRINAYGVRIDVPAVSGGIAIVNAEKRRMDAEMKAVTGGAVETCNATGALTDWLTEQGATTPGVAKADVKALLEDDELPGDLWHGDELAPMREDGPVRKALLLRQVAAKASTAKMQKMLDSMGADHIARFLYQYHAAHTGRWGGRRIQPQNMMRPLRMYEDLDMQEAIIAALTQGWSPDRLRVFFGVPMDAIASVMRGFLIPHVGNEFVVGDYSNIEGRGVAWLCGDDDKLDVFRAQDDGTGPEVYIVAGAKVFAVDPATLTKKSMERQIGKVAELALGFEGGAGAFKSMARIYGINDIPDRRADEIVQAWRDAHPKLAGVRSPEGYGRRGGYWKAAAAAAIEATEYPGRKVYIGPAERSVTFLVNGSFLWTRMPSGRVICYPYPEIRQVMTPWGKPQAAFTYMTPIGGDKKTRSRIILDNPDDKPGKFARVAATGGLFVENFTQGICRDVQAEAMARLASKGLPISMHTHDEIVGEVKEGRGRDLLPVFVREMEVVPAWAAGLPVKVDGWFGHRYGKH